MFDTIWRNLSRASTERHLKSEVSKILKEYNIKTSTLASLDPYIKTKADYFLRDKYRDGMGSIMRLLNPKEIMEAALGVIGNESIMREIDKGLIETKTYILKGKDDLKNIQILKPKDVKQPYQHLANGESYKAGGAGDYSHYDPTKPYNPAKQEQPSELSDTLFGRNSLKAGNFNAKEQVKSLQSSPNFELANINYLEQEKDDLQMRLENFYNGQFRKIGEAMALLVRCVLVSFSEKKDKNKISRWLKKVINGREYYLSDQDIANTTNLIRSLADKEYNYYLKSFENQMFIFETKNTLSRYNFGEDKGEVVKKRSYQMDSFKDNSEEKNKAQSVILQTEDEKILSYIKNPNQLLEQKAQAEAKLKNANALEKQIYECLLVYDELKDSTQGLSEYQKAVEKRFFSPIKNPHTNKQIVIYCIRNKFESEKQLLNSKGERRYVVFSEKAGMIHPLKFDYTIYTKAQEAYNWLRNFLGKFWGEGENITITSDINALINPYNLNAQESSLIPTAPSYEPFFKMQEFASLGYEDIDSYFEYLKETNLVYYAQIEADECQELYNYATNEETIKLYQELEKQGLV